MNFWKKSLVALSISALALPVAAFAEADVPAASQQSASSSQVESIREKSGLVAHTSRANIKKAIHESASLGVHKKMYYSLLSEKYTPADTEHWQAALAERERLLGGLKALKPTDEQKAAIKENRIKELQQFREEHKNGTLDKKTLQARIQELKGSWQEMQELKDKDWDGTMAARKDLLKLFTEAIESADAAAISQAMPQLLAQIQEENAALAGVIAKLQAELQQAAAPTLVPTPSAVPQ